MIPIGAIESATASATRATDATPKAGAPDPKLLQAAKDFEAIFVRQMLKSVEKTTAAGGSTKPTAGQSTYGSMIVDSLSESITKGGGLGLADVVARSMMAAHALSKPGASPATVAPGAPPTPAPGLLPTLKPLK
ncbi:MAG TPA: rod-binding protein [Polyangiaceae bacterium]|nr:rod-binding protein [Polyangiaceae bacterium]